MVNHTVAERCGGDQTLLWVRGYKNSCISPVGTFVRSVRFPVPKDCPPASFRTRRSLAAHVCHARHFDMPTEHSTNYKAVPEVSILSPKQKLGGKPPRSTLWAAPRENQRFRAQRFRWQRYDGRNDNTKPEVPEEVVRVAPEAVAHSGSPHDHRRTTRRAEHGKFLSEVLADL